MLDGNFALGLWAWSGLPLNAYISLMPERTDTIPDEVLESVTFVLAYRIVLTAASVVALCCVLCSCLVLIAFHMHHRKHSHP